MVWTKDTDSKSVQKKHLLCLLTRDVARSTIQLQSFSLISKWVQKSQVIKNPEQDTLFWPILSQALFSTIHSQGFFQPV